MSPELLDYINQARQSGMSDEQIKQTLLSSGWSEQDIKAAIGVGPEPVSVDQTQAGRGKFIKIGLVLLLVVALIGTALFAFSKFGGFNKNPVVNQTASPSGTPTATLNESNLIPVTQNCGTMSGDRFQNYFIEGATLTADEKSVLACMGTALAKCKAAYINFSASKTTEALKDEIVGEESGYCIHKVESSKVTSTCEFPISLISEYANSPQAKSMPEAVYPVFYFAGIGGAGIRTTIPDLVTGQSVKIQCTDK